MLAKDKLEAFMAAFEGAASVGRVERRAAFSENCAKATTAAAKPCAFSAAPGFACCIARIPREPKQKTDEPCSKSAKPVHLGLEFPLARDQQDLLEDLVHPIEHRSGRDWVEDVRFGRGWVA